MSNLSNWYFRIAMLWILAGVILGNIMGASGDHSMFPLHAHINLLGWVTMSIFAFFYRLYPAAAATTLAKVQFWIFVPVHFVQMLLLYIVLRGNAGVEPALGAASVVVGIAFLLFVINAWKFTASPATVTQPVGTAAAG
ncbi:MAG TPA: hypothetical protein VIE63_05765 [Ramlibacter sp.]|jgi:hypothetical protein